MLTYSLKISSESRYVEIFQISAVSETDFAIFSKRGIVEETFDIGIFADLGTGCLCGK